MVACVTPHIRYWHFAGLRPGGMGGIDHPYRKSQDFIFVCDLVAIKQEFRHTISANTSARTICTGT